MNGAEGFTYPMIHSWAILTDRHLQPIELDALLVLDAAAMTPDAKTSAELAEEPGNG